VLGHIGPGDVVAAEGSSGCGALVRSAHTAPLVPCARACSCARELPLAVGAETWPARGSIAAESTMRRLASPCPPGIPRPGSRTAPSERQHPGSGPLVPSLRDAPRDWSRRQRARVGQALLGVARHVAVVTSRCATLDKLRSHCIAIRVAPSLQLTALVGNRKIVLGLLLQTSRRSDNCWRRQRMPVLASRRSIGQPDRTAKQTSV
jgi:hypothetical protein